MSLVTFCYLEEGIQLQGLYFWPSMKLNHLGDFQWISSGFYHCLSLSGKVFYYTQEAVGFQILKLDENAFK